MKMKRQWISLSVYVHAKCKSIYDFVNCDCVWISQVLFFQLLFLTILIHSKKCTTSQWVEIISEEHSYFYALLWFHTYRVSANCFCRNCSFLNLEIVENSLNILQFPSSKKNSFRGNNSRKYGKWENIFILLLK